MKTVLSLFNQINAKSAFSSQLSISSQSAANGNAFSRNVDKFIGDAVVAGNLGSDQIIDYTIIGDMVNVSARLESIVKLKGWQQPVKGYQVLLDD